MNVYAVVVKKAINSLSIVSASLPSQIRCPHDSRRQSLECGMSAWATWACSGTTVWSCLLCIIRVGHSIACRPESAKEVVCSRSSMNPCPERWRWFMATNCSISSWLNCCITWLTGRVLKEGSICFRMKFGKVRLKTESSFQVYFSVFGWNNSLATL